MSGSNQSRHSALESCEQEISGAVLEILKRSRASEPDDRRGEARNAYFSPVSISPAFSDTVRLSAFTRDISPSGIGLLSVMPLEPGEVVVRLRMPGRGEVAFRTQILWCQSMGEGWYTSGGRFLSVAGDQK